MNSNNEGEIVCQLGQDASQMAVPGLAMHQVCIDTARGERDAQSHRGEHRPQSARRGECGFIHFVPADTQVLCIHLLIAEAANFEIDQAAELATEKFNVHACTTVDTRWILVSEHERLHR